MTVQARRSSAAYSKPSPYSSRAHDNDIEKQRLNARPQYHHYSRSDDEEEESESDSGPDHSSSSYPLAAGSSRRGGSNVGFRVPQRIMRWLCLGLFISLILFILTLFRFTISSSVSKVAVELPKVVSPKPPAWESFPFLDRYHGGLNNLVARYDNVPEYPGDGADVPIPIEEEEEEHDEEETQLNKRDMKLSMSSSVFNPYPDYNSPDYIKKYGEKRECFLDKDGSIRIPAVQSFPGVPKGFPEPVIGSNTMLGIRDDMCFDRFGRLGPYGLGYGVKKGGIGAGLEGHRDGAERVWEDVPPVDFRQISWADAQHRCSAANSHRFKELPEPRLNRFVSMPVGVSNINVVQEPEDAQRAAPKVGSERLQKTAVIIRTWHDFHYTPEDIMYLRAVISELSLLSGGEYTIHFLVHVKNNDLQIWADDETYERVLHDALPEEFRGMGTLWSEAQMSLVYPGLEETFTRGLPIHGVYRSTYMPMQYFAYQHPEYDYFWNWEMDVRYTGHWYHLFDKVGDWARAQPRKGMWERNARFYVPSVHGSWEDFRQMVRVQTESGTNSPNNMWSVAKPDGQDKNRGPDGVRIQGDKFIWGPERPDERDIFEVEGEGIPPTTMDKDQYQWGVGEDADLVVFNPLYDPEGTTWLLRDDVTGYNKENGMPPRRTAIITASRLSRKLLTTMHRETSLKHHSMFSEMWPATTALHHGFKAVYVPHAVYIDRRWPTKYLESVFNAGRNGASGGTRTSVFGDREHNFKGTTWFYSAGFSPNIWRRWLGMRVDNDGGEQQEIAGEGRMCLPPMLLHPVKDVPIVIDEGERSEDM
ncbi:uncharacterized protein N7483_003512 [Penicillium malachiteum]|uniref:uncharacterized protein n=1 Tax=Penicillium malachiteum TaxID=1324776 RepID=UPI002549131F|nr:uncharacterized protein N7483_003512 [Penicillium malachiteum]KAJ5729004.1 hypothetical protein N7483_003512 [Penicillium malachiteum]